MNTELDEVEARVVGCLIEKEGTTPDYYPLTVNALIAACNQKTNRNPVVDYNEDIVTKALDSLRDKNLVYVLFGGSSRVAKYKHLVPKILELKYPEVAAICVLLLRGPQTLGEIKARTTRLYSYDDIGQVEETLRGLEKRDEPLIVNLGRQPGQKEARFAHLLSGEVEIDEVGFQQVVSSSSKSKVAELEAEISDLREKLESLRDEFDEFKSKFE
jgi:uncharacterized protein YceH (UPF0502 family)